MDETRPADHLFTEFPAISTEEWEAVIRADMGEVGYGEQLIWHPTDELTVRPYYRAEHLVGLPHMAAAGERGVVPLRSAWSIQQNIRVLHPGDAAGRLRDAAEGGVDILGLDLTRYAGDALLELGPLTECIDLDKTGLYVGAGISSLSYLELLLRNGPEASAAGPKPSVFAAFDPISELARSGRFAPSWLDDAVRAAEASPSFVRLLQADAGIFHEAGADIVDETAFALAAVSEYVVQLIERGMPVDRILGRLYVSLQVGSSYFLEIARLRALRLLLAQVIGAFDSDRQTTDIPVHASVSRRNMTCYHPHSNLLRATTEAASAVIGGCDVLVVHPFDGAEREPSDFAYRLARNLQHLLRHEAYADRVNDPSAGSYYVEVLTDALGRAAWRRFQEIERQGGLLKAFESGFVHDAVGASRDRLTQSVARRERVLVGTNRYPDPDEQRHGADPDLSRSPDAAPGGGRRRPRLVARPLEPQREAKPIETLRMRTDRYAERTGRRPSACVLPCGEPSARSVRTHFAADFLGCAGLEIRLETGVEAPGDVPSAAALIDTDFLVVAGPNACYDPDVLHQIQSTNRFAGIGIVSDSPIMDDADFHLFPGANLVRTLAALQGMLGMDVSDDVPRSKR